jgi:hypothetical protein
MSMYVQARVRCVWGIAQTLFLGCPLLYSSHMCIPCQRYKKAAPGLQDAVLCGALCGKH